MPIEMPSRLISNASGVHCVAPTSLNELFDSESTHVVTKSCTRDARMGNPHPRYWSDGHGSVNSSGLPNMGYRAYMDYIPPSRRLYKPYIISVCGLTLEENIEIFKAIQVKQHEEKVSNIDGIELNLSCPNVGGKGQIGYDMESMTKYLDTLVPLLPPRDLFTFGVKLPPYFDPTHFDEVASVLSRYQRLDSVTAINSLGNGLIIDVETDKPRIAPRGGFGGIGGKYCLPTALANVRQHFMRLTPYCKRIVGCGGVSDGATMYQHILCGASEVQVGTQLYDEGPDCFKRILDEFQELCEKKGHQSLYSFRGDF